MTSQAGVLFPAETRQALLQRLADDLAVMTADSPGPLARASGRCCEVTVVVRGGASRDRRWGYFFCGGPYTGHMELPAVECDHVHHKWDVFLG